MQASTPLPYSFSSPGAITPSTFLPPSTPSHLHHQLWTKNRKRKIDRACDACRRKKTKCDGPKMLDSVCTNCIQTKRPCTYVESSKPRGPPKAYVTGLEDRLEQMEALLQKMCPDSDFSEILGPPVIRGSWKSTDEQPPQSHTTSRPPIYHPTTSIAPYASHTSTLPFRSTPTLSASRSTSSPSNSSPGPVHPALSRSTHLIIKSPPDTKRSRTKPLSSRKTRTDDPDGFSSSDFSSSSGSSSDTDELVESFSGNLQRLTLPGIGRPVGDDEGQTRLYGKSSSMTLVTATRALKEKMLSSINAEEYQQRQSQGMQGSSVTGDRAGGQRKVVSHRRPEFWRTPPWEQVWEGLSVGSTEIIQSLLPEFPSPDLCTELIELYFTHVNSQFPLLHRPTFMRQFNGPDPLYKKDLWFAAVCVCLFAVASRWYNFEILPPELEQSEGEETDWVRLGWKYFYLGLSIHRLRRSLIRPACLFEVQTFTLLGMFLRGTARQPVAWFIVSIGVRKAQDVGAHRKKVYNNKASVDEELWKRAFWCLVAFDRIGSTTLGRPCGIGEEDFDIDLPLEVDDEYWETDDPAKAFVQPPGKPALVTAFNLWVRLTQIWAFALRTIYAVDKSKALGRIAREWPGDVRAQLNMAMSEWLESVPEHLRWSPDMKNNVFANQSATMYTTYHLAEILIHRPFICPPRPPHSSSKKGPKDHIHDPLCPALVICSEAARSCARIFERQLQRGLSNVPNLAAVGQMCAAILLVTVWNLKAEQKAKSAEDAKPRFAQRIDELMKDVRVFMTALEWVAPRWECAASHLQQLRDSLPSSDDDFGIVSAVPTSNDDAVDQHAIFDQASFTGPSVLNQISMASSHLFPMEVPSRHDHQGQSMNDWSRRPAFSEWLAMLDFQVHTQSLAASDPSIVRKHEFPHFPSYPDEHQNMHDDVRLSRAPFPRESGGWQPISRSSSLRPLHSSRSQSQSRPSSVSVMPRSYAEEIPPISAMRRTSFSGLEQHGNRDDRSYDRYPKRDEMFNLHSGANSSATNLLHSETVDNRPAYNYQLLTGTAPSAIQGQIPPQTAWDNEDNYRVSDWGSLQHAAPMTEHTNSRATWVGTADSYSRSTSDVHRMNLERELQASSYAGAYNNSN